MNGKTILEDIGFQQAWGFTPAQDLQQMYAAYAPSKNALSEQETALDADTLNILLIEPGDVRDILKTISQRRRSKSRKLNFYVWEPSSEIIARHLLLLSLALDWDNPIKQRANAFLEVFGNCLLQERTASYVMEKGLELIDLVSDQVGPFAALVDLSCMKYKERDELVETFRSWNTSVHFDIVKLRDTRLRRHFAERYDFRSNIIDWDYTMMLAKIEEMKIVHYKQYREWRQTGIAFEFGDQTYTIPNRTMATYVQGRHKVKRSSVMVRGFWLDITVGPYVGLGIDCHKGDKHAEELFQVFNKGTGTEQHRHHAVEIAVYNLISFLYEIETGSVYHMKQKNEIYSGLGQEDEGDEDETSAIYSQEGANPSTKVVAAASESASNFPGKAPAVANSLEGKSSVAVELKNEGEHATLATSESSRAIKEHEDAMARATSICESIADIKIHFLTGSFESVFSRKRLNAGFDVMKVSSTSAHLLQSKKTECNQSIMSEISSPNAVLTVDSARYLITLQPEQKMTFLGKIREIGGQNGWSEVKPEPGTRRNNVVEDGHGPVALFFKKQVHGVAIGS